MHTQIILVILSPIYISIVICLLIVGWRLITNWLGRNRKKWCMGQDVQDVPVEGMPPEDERPPVMDYLKVTILGTVFVLYPSVVQATMSIFSCQVGCFGVGEDLYIQRHIYFLAPSVLSTRWGIQMHCLLSDLIMTLLCMPNPSLPGYR